MLKAKAAPRARALRPAVVVPLVRPIVRYDIETTFGLIEALGGMDATAKEYCTTVDGMKRWAISGDIPTGWHLRIFGKVCALGKTISPCVFGFREDDEAAKALARLMAADRFVVEGGDND